MQFLLPRARTRASYALVAAVCAVVGALTVGVGGLVGPADGAVEPSPTTIVDVTGDRDNGFSIHFYDGSSAHPPTLSEARAECGEYATRAERIRCRTEVRVWYADLGAMKRTIAYYRSRLRS